MILKSLLLLIAIGQVWGRIHIGEEDQPHVRVPRQEKTVNEEAAVNGGQSPSSGDSEAGKMNAPLFQSFTNDRPLNDKVGFGLSFTLKLGL